MKHFFVFKGIKNRSIHVFTLQGTYLIFNRGVIGLEISAFTCTLHFSQFASKEVKGVNYFPSRANYLEF